MARILIASGAGPYSDPWHPFERTSPLIAEVLRGAGHTVEVRDTIPGSLRDIGDFELFVANAGGGIADESEPPSSSFDDDLRALGRYLEAQRPVLSIHTSNGAFGQLAQWRIAVGGQWGEGSFHPEISEATFVPVPGRETHPVWDGLESVEVFDECYCGLEFDTGVEPLVQHILDGQPQVMGWAAGERTLYDGLGHDERSYEAESRNRLLVNQVAWLLRPSRASLSAPVT